MSHWVRQRRYGTALAVVRQMEGSWILIYMRGVDISLFLHLFFCSFFAFIVQNEEYLQFIRRSAGCWN